MAYLLSVPSKNRQEIQQKFDSSYNLRTTRPILTSLPKNNITPEDVLKNYDLLEEYREIPLGQTVLLIGK
jgi:hypothetical protein